MKFGVLQFPGSCDEVDALYAARRVGDAELLWHRDRDLKGADAIVVPGGFSYGDYLRAGAIARFSPVMESVIAFASEGGIVLGICNGFQVLCEANLLPGALLPNTNLRFTFRQVDLDVVEGKTAFTGACEGARLSIPAKHSWGRYYADEQTLAAMQANGQVVMRYAAGENFNGSVQDIAGVCNEQGNVFGLMPHPEHAVDELTGSVDGLCIFASMRLAAEGARSSIPGEGDRQARVSSAPLPNVRDALALGLTEGEYELICEKQGRAPNQVELAMYSLLWSEHCAYKHSKKLLGTLPTEGEYVVMGPGENAGAIDLGDGLVCAFKVESHNHPSAVEPFQGAATGVGGILRDIFAIGARPIAVLDSLRFGEPEIGLPYPFNGVEEDKGRSGRGSDRKTAQQSTDGEDSEKLAEKRSNLAANRSRYLLDRAVAGIGHYGNSIGVPTIGGEVYFEAPYEQNCLVNAMALGIGERDKLIRSAAAGIGNVVVLFGASTGRDGIGGASVLASAELGGEDDDKRPTVQVGDPFEEKKLMECSLELLQRGLIVSLQDLGAAGLTSSASEMASKGEVGIDIDVAKVPLREADMEPFEVMVSESQERMLCVVEPSNIEQVLALCEKWEVGGAAIGTVTDSGHMRVFDGGKLVGEMPVRALVDDCPLYDLEPVKPTRTLYAAPKAPLPPKNAPREMLLALLASPNIASRRPLFEQYDSVVQSRTVRRPEQADAAVLAIRPLDGSEHGPIPGIAVSIDCNGRRVAADPYTGTIAAALECASNLACAGAQPLGTTNNLNFGNPEKPHIAWQLTESVRGLGDACRALQAPIVGGNVSLYNEGASAGPIYPTPVVGMVGKLGDVRHAGRGGFAHVGDAIAIVGPFTPSLPASELAKLRGEQLPDGLPPIDIDAVVAAQAAVRDGVRSGVLASAHDIAEGGVAIALAECCLSGNLGARMQLEAGMFGADGAGATGPALDWSEHLSETAATLFGECSGAFLVSGDEAALRTLGERTGVELIGFVEGESLIIGELIDLSLAALAEAHSALAELFA